jgi:UDP-N-acetyl-D-mannosaminuronic acid dehydrogenase
MKTIIYPNNETDLTGYEKINSDEIIIYDKTGDIETDLPKESSLEIFSNADNIIFTQNCIINGEYDITPLKRSMY